MVCSTPVQMSLDAKIKRAMGRGGSVQSSESPVLSPGASQTPVPKSKGSAQKSIAQYPGGDVADSAERKTERPTGRVVTFKIAQAKGLKRQDEFKVDSCRCQACYSPTFVTRTRLVAAFA